MDAAQDRDGQDPTAGIWRALGGDPAAPARLRTTGGAAGLPARLPVDRLARATVAACALAAAEYAAPGARPTVDGPTVGAAFRSERLLRIDGREPLSFAPLSRFWRTADGWVRTHANYPHHRARLLTALDLPAEAAPEAVAAALAVRRAAEVEEAVYAAGGLAVAVRDRAGWAAHPQSAAVAELPLVGRESADEAAPLAPADPTGLRVLDLTRVLAGPVAGRVLALLGADVLRIGPPHLPESPELHADTGFGKRSAQLDLAAHGDRAVFDALLDRAHVVLTGYRPGALDRFGLSPAALAARRPGLVVARLDAWGDRGPWRQRRGFDSLVQAATGIAWTEAADAGTGAEADRPGALPVQALDHGSGCLLAAAVLRALADQRAGTAGGVLLRVTLARTAQWLLDAPPPEAGAEPAGPAPPLPVRQSPVGLLRHAPPPFAVPGLPTDWASPPGAPGADPPRWRTAAPGAD